MVHHECKNCTKLYEELPKRCESCGYDKFQSVVLGEPAKKLPKVEIKLSVQVCCPNCANEDIKPTDKQCGVCNLVLKQGKQQVSKDSEGDSKELPS